MSSEPRSDDALPPTTPAAERLPAIIRSLREAHPDARCALDHHNPYELLVATILSAQCTDERVNQVTPALFARYPSPAAMAEADREELEALIRSTGFYHNKAEYLQEASRRLAADYGGQVPAEMEKLLELPGVARKTANVVLGVCFGRAEGIVVDTHVKRVAGRLALTAESDPAKIERDLMAIVPREEWIDLAHLLIFHGRRVCHARKPACPQCVLRSLCPSAEG
jgi:endonuclease-3